jgi:hypothetical protein
VKVFFINNEGSGFADHVDVEPGTNVEQFFRQRMHGAKPSDYLIRVNRQPCPSDQVLQEQDRISITALKIHGAAR